MKLFEVHAYPSEQGGVDYEVVSEREFGEQFSEIGRERLTEEVTEIVHRLLANKEEMWGNTVGVADVSLRISEEGVFATETGVREPFDEYVNDVAWDNFMKDVNIVCNELAERIMEEISCRETS